MARHRSKGQGTLFKRDGHGPWIASWYDHSGKRREASTRTTDRAAAERILSKHVADTALRRDGVIDARSDGYSAADRKSIANHLIDWRDSLLAKGVTARQVALLQTRVKVILDAVKATRPSDLSASAIQTAIGELSSGDDGWGLQTCQHYLRAVKQFARWMKRDGRTRDDVLSHLSGFNASTDKRYERRPLEADELTRLVDAAENAPTWRGMTGPDRAMAYRVAAGTGFRVNELRNLTKDSFRLGDDPPAIALRAAHSKRRRDDRQPIRDDLADILQGWLASKPDDRPVFSDMPEKTAMMIRLDLRRARAQWIREGVNQADRRERRESDCLAVEDSAGRLIDFHALRVTYITLLVRGGASVKVAQELARHSDPKLTLNTYTRLGMNDLSGALDALPAVSSKEPEREALRATGTLGKGPDDPQLYPQQLGRETVRSRANRRDGVSTVPQSRHHEIVNARKGESDIVPVSATPCDKAADRTRTDDLRFTKPLLYQLSYGGVAVQL